MTSASSDRISLLRTAFAESIGTFALVLAGTGAVIVEAQTDAFQLNSS